MLSPCTAQELNSCAFPLWIEVLTAAWIIMIIALNTAIFVYYYS